MVSVIIPTDFSTQAKNAITYAFKLFDASTTKFILVNTYQEPHASSTMLISIKDIMLEDSEKKLQEELAWITEQFPAHAVQCTTRSEYGQFTYTINYLVRKLNADMVVLGTKGLANWKHWFINSNSALLTNSNHFPVLVVPDDYNVAPPARVVFSSDLKKIPENTLTAIKLFGHVIKKNCNSFTVLNIHSPHETLSSSEIIEKNKLITTLEYLNPVFETTPHNEVFIGLNLYCTTKNTHLLIMIARSHTFFEKLMNPSNTKEMAMLGNIPLLVFPESYN